MAWEIFKDDLNISPHPNTNPNSESKHAWVLGEPLPFTGKLAASHVKGV